MTPEPIAIAAAILAFLCGGFVKGLTGIGLPLVAFPLMSLVLPIPVAVSLTILPIVASNAWQALGTGGLARVLRRFWPLQLTILAVVLPASRLLVALDDSVLHMSAGAVLVLSAIGLGLSSARALPPRWETVAGVSTGVVSGLMGGVSSLLGVPVIIYLTALNLPRAEFVKSISFIYLISVGTYAVGLLWHGAIAPPDLFASALCILPTMAGLAAGVRVMRNADKALFRRLLLGMLILMGLMMIVQGVAGVLSRAD